MRRRLAVLIAAAAMAIGVMSSTAGAVPLFHPASATFTSGPDTVTSFQCVPATQPVTCHGAAGGEAVYSGGWTGASHYDYRFIILPSGSYIVDSVERFHGTVDGCGKGTFVIRTHETIAASGEAHGRWAIASGGTGDFVNLTGVGTSTAVYAVDGTGGGTITGRLLCGD